MKKFLSLLLALTLVLSLVVVPARAHDVIGIDYDSWATDVSSGNQNKTLTITGAAEGNTFTWSSSNSNVASVPDNSTTASVQVTAKAAGDATITCVIKASSAENAETLATKTCSVTVTNKKAELEDSVSAVTLNTRPYAKGQSGFKVYYVSGDNINTAGNWNIVSSKAEKNGVTVSGGTATINLKSKDPSDVTSSGRISVTLVEATATGNVTVSPSSNHRVGQKMTFSLPDTVTNKDSSNASFAWTVKSAASGTPTVAQGTTKDFEWIPNATGTFTVECAVKEDSAVVGTVNLGVGNSITVAAENYEAAFTGVTTNSAVVVYGSSAQYTAPIPKPYLRSVKSGIDNVPYESLTNVSYQSSNESIATVSSSGLVTARSTTGTATITVKFTYLDKDYTETYTIYNRAPSHTIPTSIQAGAATPYDAATLRLYASTALTTAGIPVAAASITGISSVAAKSNCTVTQPTYGSTTYYVTGATFGTATFTGTVSTYSNGTYPITFTVAVKPQATTYEDQYPEPVAYGNTYRYYVQVPSGFTSYYVLGTPNQTTEPNWTLTGTQYYGSTLYYLTDANFVGGKCTLWLVTKDSYGRYYCGQLTVYQKNYNINYNGVTGETVQFAQSDFTDFMNEVAEARGDASKTKSYPYVTFDYVTFSLPTTAQGTLYYGGTAMSTSNSSGAFNTRTKVTNLDSVTFVPNAKTTAKTITLNFTLHATYYASSTTSRGVDRPYSGSVVVNLVREDIKYTVSQGDSVRFDESDFLSYLRSTKGYSSNYTIDYVTFDQSAVSAVNEGSLYTYYNGYNYGGSIKTTDKFYYSATASQNALSDVAFLASRYAKTGETVYIPFTIYARYGTTGTGTRQLTGTVAIKIGQTMNFIDVKTTDYFYNSVKWAVGKNITNGTSSTTFSPYKSCTRAEIVTFLWRAAGSPEPTTTRNPFRDVNAVTHSSYYKAILWASQKGITSGTSTTAFSPDQVCTRAQIVTFLYRYAGQPSGYYSNPFKDVSATSEASYYNAVLWAVGKGITTGTSATTFSPYASCNRAEAVTFLYRYTNGL